MLRLVVIGLLLVAACKDDSGRAHKVSAAPIVKPVAPEPPGGPPSCADVGSHLAAGLDMPSNVDTTVAGAQITVSGDSMRGGMETGLADACRDAAWSHDTRVCVMSWSGNILHDRAKLAEACPGTVTK